MRIRTAVLTRAAALGAAGILLAACGGSQTVESDPPPSEPTPTSASPEPSESPSDKTPGMPDATPPDDPNWKPLIRISGAKGEPGGNSLVLGYTLPTPCTPGLREAEVTQRDDAVTITLHRRKPQASDQKLVCTQVIQNKTVQVALDAPLGDRPVVDGSSGKEIKVTR